MIQLQQSLYVERRFGVVDSRVGSRHLFLLVDSAALGELMGWALPVKLEIAGIANDDVLVASFYEVEAARLNLFQ